MPESCPRRVHLRCLPSAQWADNLTRRGHASTIPTSTHFTHFSRPWTLKALTSVAASGGHAGRQMFDRFKPPANRLTDSQPFHPFSHRVCRLSVNLPVKDASHSQKGGQTSFALQVDERPECLCSRHACPGHSARGDRHIPHDTPVPVTRQDSFI